MLTPGEFVVNANATSKHLPLLKTINSGAMSNGGVVYAQNGQQIPNNKPVKTRPGSTVPFDPVLQEKAYNISMLSRDERPKAAATFNYNSMQKLAHDNVGPDTLFKSVQNNYPVHPLLEADKSLKNLGLPRIFEDDKESEMAIRTPEWMRAAFPKEVEKYKPHLEEDGKRILKHGLSGMPGGRIWLLRKIHGDYGPVYDSLMDSNTTGHQGYENYLDQWQMFHSPEEFRKASHLARGGVVYAQSGGSINKPDPDAFLVSRGNKANSNDSAAQAIKRDQYQDRARSKAYESFLRRFGRYRPEDPQAARDVVQTLQKNGNQQELDRAVRTYAQIKDAKAQIDRENKASWGATGFNKGGVVYLNQGGGFQGPGFDLLSPFDQIRAERMIAAEEAKEERKKNAFYTRSRLGGLFKRIDDQLEMIPDEFEIIDPDAIDEALTSQKVIDDFKQKIQGLQGADLDNKVIELRSVAKNRYNKLMEYVTNSKEGYNTIMSNNAFGATSRVLEGVTYANILKKQVTSGSKETTALKEAWLKIDRAFPAGKNADQNQANMQQFINMMGIMFNQGLQGLAGGRPRGMSVGGVVYANKGQLIPYQPKGTDTVPAMLTPGEFVINRQATQKNLPLLKAINNNQLASGGMVSPIYAQAGSQIPSSNNAGGLPNFNQIFGPLTATVTQFSKALSLATPFLNQIATFASNTNFQSQQGGVSNNRDNGESGSLSLDGISQFTTKFEEFIGQLKGLNLPPIINVQGNHKVEVVFNGASTLENLATESIQAMVLKEVNSAMNKLNQDTEGALGGKS
jgi:hypothetical protein